MATRRQTRSTSRTTVLDIMNETSFGMENTIKNDKIVELEQLVSSLQQQLTTINHSVKLNAIKSYEIDEILDEVEENEQKYQEMSKSDHNNKEKKEEEEEEEEEEDDDETDVYDDDMNDDDNDDDDHHDEHEEEGEDKPKLPEFWNLLNNKLKDGDIEYIKDLVRNKKLKMDELDGNGRNLLMLAAYYGSYELVSICINLGSDIDKEDNLKQTALKIAKDNGFPDIEELLIMNQLKTELGEKIKSTTNDISTKQGITTNFIRILKDIFTETKQDENRENENIFNLPKRQPISNEFLSILVQALSGELLETLLNIQIKSISERVAYSNDILHICFYYEVYIKNRLPTNTLLYKAIKYVTLNIISHTNNKKDWFWLKQYILSSSIWYFHIDPNDDKSQYLWYKALKWIEEKTKTQSIELSKPMRIIQNNDITQWNKLRNYNVETEIFTVRQDQIDHGLKAEYTKHHLIENISLNDDDSFNALTHYDLSQYLTKLVLLCHKLDDEFQKDIQEIFDIHGETKQNKHLKVLYIPGRIKTLQRCYIKCKSQYKQKTFPTAAHLLDIIHCCLVFDDVSSMLEGMDHFQQEIAEKEYCILEVVRVNNGFCEYSHESASYTDIKMNVIVAGNEHNIIAEIRFVFRRMLDYKQMTHSLYNIERRKEFVDDLSLVLPFKLDLKTKLFIDAERGNIDGLTDLMTTHNFKKHELLQLNQRNQSILTPICSKNNETMFNYLVDVIPKHLLRERLIFAEPTGSYPLKRAIENNHYNGVLKIILKDDQFNLINYTDKNQETPIKLCWNKKRGKCALLILKTVKTNKERLKLIDYTGPEPTALQNALLSADIECVSFILDELDENTELKLKLLHAKDIKEQTNFHYVCQGGSVQCLQLLLKHCNSDKLREQLWISQDIARTVPLHHAVINAKTEITDFLLTQLDDAEKCRFFDTPSLYGRLPIDELISKTTKEHLECLKVVISHLSTDDKYLGKLFLIAAQNDNIELGQLIINKTSNIKQKCKVLNYQNAATQCALTECCINNNTQFLTYLLDEFGDDYKSFIFKSNNGRCGLMEAAARCYIKCCRLILNKICEQQKILKKVLTMKDTSDQTALLLAINATTKKNNEKCAKLILRYYDVKDSECIFLACLRLSDIERAQAIWNNTNGDKEKQNKLLSITDKEKYNCFLLVCNNGNYQCLEWLLTLSDDEEHLMQKHPISGKTPLLLCVAADDRRKPKDEKQKILTDEEKANYFKCSKRIFDKVSVGRDLIFDKDNINKTVLHYACNNANIQSVSLLLSQLHDAKDQRSIIDRIDYSGYNCFHFAVKGGNIELVQMIYGLYRKYDKVKQLTEDDTPLMIALENGYEHIAEWLLFTLLSDTNKKLRYLNSNINIAKPGKAFEAKIKTWITNILDKEVKIVNDVRDIVDIFSWILRHEPIDQLCIKLILDKICKDEYSKSTFIKQSGAICYSCQHNLFQVLEKLLIYLQDFTSPLFEGVTNSLIGAINSRSNKCVELILDSIQDNTIKNLLIESCNTSNENALMRAISMKCDKMIELIFKHHSDIDVILGEAFIYGLQHESPQYAKKMLDKTTHRSKILNYRTVWGHTALNIALKQKTDHCLKFIVNELTKDLQIKEDHDEELEELDDEKESIHSMYLAVTDDGRNIFHEMFQVEVTMKNIKILQSILDKTIIKKLLLSRCYESSFLPIHYAIKQSQSLDVTKWLISQFDDDILQQFSMLAQRTEYHSMLISFGIRDKAIKTFIAKTLYKCLKQIDFKQIDIIIIKDIFNCTVGWEYKDLQQLILDNIPTEHHPYLFNKDDRLNDWGHILHRIIRADQEEMGKILLSAITDDKQLMVRDIYGLYLIPRGMLQGSIKVMKLILDRLKYNDQLINQQNYGCDSGGYRGFFYAWSYKRHECAMQVVSYLKDEYMHIAVNEAAKHDKELTIIPALFAAVSSNQAKQKLMLERNAKGENLLLVAIHCNMRKVVEWIVNDQINDTDDAIFKAADWTNNSTPILQIAGKDNSYCHIFQTVLNKLSPKERFDELLRKNFNRESVIKRVLHKKNMETICNNILCEVMQSMQIIDDIDILFPLFEFCCFSKNIKTLKMVLSKTPKHVKNKLFMNYEKGRSWNVIKHLTTTDKKKKEILFEILKIIEPKQKIAILKDVKNPNLERYNALRNCIQTADMECFTAILKQYEESKENVDILLKSLDKDYKTALYSAIEHNKDDIAIDILQRITDEIEAINMLNRKTKTTETNIFDIIASPKIKKGLKKLIPRILKNIKHNGLGIDAFFPYFRWLCNENEIDDIKKLVKMFEHKDTNFMYKLLKNLSGASKHAVLHNIASSNYYELLTYFLSYINTNEQIEEYLLIEDLFGNNPFLLSCSNDSNECTELLINEVKFNQKLLSQMILTRNSSGSICIDYQITKTKIEGLELILKYSENELILQKLFIASIKHNKQEFAEKILQKGQCLNMNLFNHMDNDGNIPLYHALSTGNTKFAQIILNKINRDDKATIDYLVQFRNHCGTSLLHAACKSTNIATAKLILSICQFQRFRNELLLSTDNEGNVPLQLYFNTVSMNKCAEISEFVLWYISNLKTNKEKLSLLSHCNLSNISTLNYNLIKSNQFGASLFKRLISSIDCCTENDIISWSKLLEVAIQINHDTKSVVKLIIDKYRNNRHLIIKLLATKNHHSQNAFYNASVNCTSCSVLKYILSFIDDDEDNKYLLFEPSYSSSNDGNTALHKVINDMVRGCMITHKFDLQKSRILFTTNDNNKYILDHARSSAVTLVHLKQLTQQQLIQSFVDNITDRKLYCYFLDHEDELMPKLLFSRCRNGYNRTYLENMIYNMRSAKYLFKWSIEWIKKLNENDIIKLLSASNIYGETIIHFCCFFKEPEYLETILSLYPNQELKEKALLCQTNNGKTPFQKAFTYSTHNVGHIIWNNIKNIHNKLTIINTNCHLFKSNIDSYGITSYIKNWQEMLKNLLMNDMKDQYIDDCTLLIPWFYIAVKANDIEFAKFIVSKIDKKDTMKFITTKITINEENCLHFAAYCKLSQLMEILINMMEDINYDLNKILLNEEIIKNKYDETPLSIACKKNNFYVVKYILSLLKHKKDKLKLIEMDWKYETTKTKDNYKNKNQYQLHINCIATCCFFKHFECLKVLLINYNNKDIKSIIHHKNNRKQSIYRFIKSVDISRYLKSNYKTFTFGFKEMNENDIDGISPFMALIKYSAKLRLITWALNQCAADSEKLKLIYNSDRNGENALDLSGNGSVQSLFMINTIKYILSTYQKIKDIEYIIPIFLYSLKTGKLDLTHWLLSLLNNNSDKKKLINCSNKFGINAVLSAVKGGQMRSLQFLLSHQLFDPNLIFKTDRNGLTAIHYACFTNSISVLNTILTLYSENGHGKFSDLMFIKDRFGNIPFDYILRKGNISNFIFKWIINNCFNHNNDKRKKLMMLFGNKNKKNEISLIELYLRQNDMLITKCIKSYFDEIEEIYDNDIEIVGHILMYLHNFSWTLSKYIISKIKNNELLNKILNVVNSDNYNLLLYVCKDSSIHIVNWLINIIPNNHSILLSKENVNGKTALMHLLDRALVIYAQNILNKINDKKERLQLIQSKDNQNKSILDDAKEQNIQNRINWIQTQINNCN